MAVRGPVSRPFFLRTAFVVTPSSPKRVTCGGAAWHIPAIPVALAVPGKNVTSL
jgi:hypothetical protein